MQCTRQAVRRHDVELHQPSLRVEGRVAVAHDRLWLRAHGRADHLRIVAQQHRGGPKLAGAGDAQCDRYADGVAGDQREIALRLIPHAHHGVHGCRLPDDLDLAPRGVHVQGVTQRVGEVLDGQGQVGQRGAGAAPDRLESDVVQAVGAVNAVQGDDVELHHPKGELDVAVAAVEDIARRPCTPNRVHHRRIVGQQHGGRAEVHSVHHLDRHCDLAAGLHDVLRLAAVTDAHQCAGVGLGARQSVGLQVAAGPVEKSIHRAGGRAECGRGQDPRQCQDDHHQHRRQKATVLLNSGTLIRARCASCLPSHLRTTPA